MQVDLVASAEGSLAGFNLRSDFDLSPIIPPRPLVVGDHPLHIRRVSTAELQRQALAHPTAVRFAPGHPGEFLIPSAAEVLVAPAPGASDQSILSFVFGPCFAVATYLRRTFPLHASSVQTGDGCVAFCGRSGAGKSTLAAALCARGYAFHSDDTCLIRFEQNGVFSWPGIAWFRLTDASAAALAYPLPDDASKGNKAKHTLPLEQPSLASHTRRLRAIYTLQAALPHEPCTITRITGARAVEPLVAHAYRAGLAMELGMWPWVVSTCAQAAQRVPVYVLRRALDFEQLASTLDVLEQHLASLPVDACASI